MTNYPDLIPQKFMVFDDGSNAPLLHQRTIARLTAKLYPYYEAGTIRYEPIPEMMVGEYNSPTPDVILYDNVTEQSPVIIEICHAKGQKSDLKKVIRLIEEDDYGVLEGFVFNYKTQTWLRYRKGDGGVAAESSISEILQLDLGVFV
ncbi:MAG: hypothetical protein H7Z72_13410 [Bacteroidetes bacterium]|nr:hypothetical protein [Fibrella sp.]